MNIKIMYLLAIYYKYRLILTTIILLLIRKIINKK
ncbi:hypothetical protein GFK87_00187 [Candidatus Annandia pinicola]|nr:hypothetical protein GFK87_00187 [Candidatus Annandia pinicola]